MCSAEVLGSRHEMSSEVAGVEVLGFWVQASEQGSVKAGEFSRKYGMTKLLHFTHRAGVRPRFGLDWMLSSLSVGSLERLVWPCNQGLLFGCSS